MIEPTKPMIDDRPIDWDNDRHQYRMHWWDRPGGGWTFPGALAYTINEITVHWAEQNTPPGKPDDFYLARLAAIARFHAFNRDWEPARPGMQGSNGIQYHYCIAPTGYTVQTCPETLRTWNAYAANGRNIAVCLLTGSGDTIQPGAVQALRALLNWLVFGRPDELPLVKPTRQQVTVLRPDGHTYEYLSLGVLTHDESLIAQGRPTKGCCGIYAPVVADWRQLAISTGAG